MSNLTLECPRCKNLSTSKAGLLVTYDEDAQRLREDLFNPTLTRGIDMTCGVCKYHWVSEEAVLKYRIAAYQVLTIPQAFYALRKQLNLRDREVLVTKEPNPVTNFDFPTDLYLDPRKGF